MRSSCVFDAPSGGTRGKRGKGDGGRGFGGIGSTIGPRARLELRRTLRVAGVGVPGLRNHETGSSSCREGGGVLCRYNVTEK